MSFVGFVMRWLLLYVPEHYHQVGNTFEYKPTIIICVLAPVARCFCMTSFRKTISVNFIVMSSSLLDKKKIELEHNKTNKMTCAPSKDSDQTAGHLPSLIRVFVALYGEPRTKAFFWQIAKTLIRLGRCPG